MINKNYIDIENFSILKMPSFDKNSKLNQEFTLIVSENNKLKSKIFLQPTKLKHLKKPVNIFPVFDDNSTDRNNIYKLYIDIGYIELNNYLINLSPIIIDIRNRDEFDFNDPLNHLYPLDRAKDVLYSNGWFYIYMGLDTNNEIDIKISKTDPYRYGKTSTESYFYSGDPLYIYEDNIWYRAIGCFAYGYHHFSLESGQSIYPEFFIKSDYVVTPQVTLYKSTNANYVIRDLYDFVPKITYSVKIGSYRQYMQPLNREDLSVFGGYHYHGHGNNSGYNIGITNDMILFDGRIKSRATKSGTSSVLRCYGFKII